MNDTCRSTCLTRGSSTGAGCVECQQLAWPHLLASKSRSHVTRKPPDDTLAPCGPPWGEPSHTVHQTKGNWPTGCQTSPDSTTQCHLANPFDSGRAWCRLDPHPPTHARLPNRCSKQRTLLSPQRGKHRAVTRLCCLPSLSHHGRHSMTQHAAQASAALCCGKQKLTPQTPEAPRHHCHYIK